MSGVKNSTGKRTKRKWTRPAVECDADKQKTFAAQLRGKWLLNKNGPHMPPLNFARKFNLNNTIQQHFSITNHVTDVRPPGSMPPHHITVVRPSGSMPHHHITVLRPPDSMPPHHITDVWPTDSMPPHHTTDVRPSGSMPHPHTTDV